MKEAIFSFKFGQIKKYLREFVYGGMDGAVTTFAIVAGASGANLDVTIIIILGFANLIADGFSMSVGAYLSAKSDRENFRKHRRNEYWEVDNIPEIERKEVEEIYKSKGFNGELLKKVVDVIVSDRDRWVDEMMKDELNLIEDNKSPLKIGLATWVSFIIIGFIPLMVYVYDFFYQPIYNQLLWTAIFTGIAFFLIGWLKSSVNQTNIFKSIGETLALGFIAALMAYLVGDILESLVLKA